MPDADPRIDLHGFDRERARVAILRLIDSSQRDGHLRIEVVTGRGKGTLGSVVRRVLDGHPKVRDFGALEPGDGCGVWVRLRPASETGDGVRPQPQPGAAPRTPGQIARELLRDSKRLS